MTSTYTDETEVSSEKVEPAEEVESSPVAYETTALPLSYAGEGLLRPTVAPIQERLQKMFRLSLRRNRNARVETSNDLPHERHCTLPISAGLLCSFV